MHYLRNQTVKVGVSGAFDVQGAPADVIDGLVVEQHSHISVFKQGVSGEDTVVGLNHRGRNLRRWVHGEPELGLLAIVHRQTLKQEGSKT